MQPRNYPHDEDALDGGPAPAGVIPPPPDPHPLYIVMYDGAPPGEEFTRMEASSRAEAIRKATDHIPDGTEAVYVYHADLVMRAYLPDERDVLDMDHHTDG